MNKPSVIGRAWSNIFKIMPSGLQMIVALFLAVAPAATVVHPVAALATTKYVNCNTGNNNNAGTYAAPYKDIWKATQNPLDAGSIIYLARGCTWWEQVYINGNGTSTAKIQILPYGSGADPKVQAWASLATGSPTARIINMQGTYQKIDHIRVTADAGITKGLFGVGMTGAHDEMTNSEIDRVGIAVDSSGQYNSMYEVHAHDLIMVHNDWGSPGTEEADDDYGAVGFNIAANNNTVSYSDCTNCRATSYDYGYDGGFVEVWNDGDNLSVHHNTGYNTQGIMEVGGEAGGDNSADNISMRYNNFTSHGGLMFHTGTQFEIPISNQYIACNKFIGMSSSDMEMNGGNLGTMNLLMNVIKPASGAAVTWGDMWGAPGSHTYNKYSVSRYSPSYPFELIGYALGTGETYVTDGSTPTLPSGCAQ